jgi:ribosome-associated protein
MTYALTMAKRIAKTLDFHKGNEVRIYDVSDKTPLARFYVVVSCASKRRMNGYADIVKEALVKGGWDIGHVEGKNSSEWVVVDAHEIVVHIFSEQERARVKFDDLYQDCPQVDYSKAKAMEL